MTMQIVLLASRSVIREFPKVAEHYQRMLLAHPVIANVFAN